MFYLFLIIIMRFPQTFLNIGVWNIHGLFQNINKVRLSKLEDEEVQKRVKEFDVFFFQETACFLFKEKLVQVTDTLVDL